MLLTGLFFAILHFDIVRFLPLLIGGRSTSLAVRTICEYLACRCSSWNLEYFNGRRVMDSATLDSEEGDLYEQYISRR